MKHISPSLTALAFLASFGAASAQVGFDQLDQNRDDIITVDEYDLYALAPFVTLDIDQNNKLSASEILLAARASARGSKRNPAFMVAKLLLRFDENRDQNLSIYELGAGGAGEFFNFYETDYNGTISRAEWDARISEAEKTGNEAPGLDQAVGLSDDPQRAAGNWLFGINR